MSGTLNSIQRDSVMTAVPRPLPSYLGPAERGTTRIDRLPVRSWEVRSLARFTYPDDNLAPDGARVYNASPVWADKETVERSKSQGYLGFHYLKAGNDFDKAIALAHELAVARGKDGDYLNGSQAVLQARNGTFYLTSVSGWGDEVPVIPGEPGGPQGAYRLEDVADAGGIVRRYTPALKAVVGESTWVDFSNREPQRYAGDEY